VTGGSKSGDGSGGAGPAVLVVEDEILIAMDLEETLRRLGCRVIGPAPTVGAALDLITRESPDAAIIDFNLGGERAEPVADLLCARGIPFLVSSAQDPATLGASACLREAMRLSKPVSEARLLAALRALMPAWRT
jgi:DNA-binding response OmpR family regulator